MAMASSSVDLPAPFSPMKKVTSAWKSMLSSQRSDATLYGCWSRAMFSSMCAVILCRYGLADSAMASALHVDAAPEGHVVLDLPGGVGRRRVVPGGVVVDLAVHGHAVITGLALPWTDAGVRAGLQVFAPERRRREVDIVFDDFDFVVARLGDDGAVPAGCGHACSAKEKFRSGGTAVAAGLLGTVHRRVRE